MGFYCEALACYCKYMLRVKCCVCMWWWWWILECEKHGSEGFSSRCGCISVFSLSIPAIPSGSHLTSGSLRLTFQWIWFVWSGVWADAVRLEWLVVCFGAWQSISLIAVIVVFVITAEGRETPQTDSIWVKYLGTCVHPYLQKERGREGEKVEKDMLVNGLHVIFCIYLPGTNPQDNNKRFIWYTLMLVTTFPDPSDSFHPDFQKISHKKEPNGEVGIVLDKKKYP